MGTLGRHKRRRRNTSVHGCRNDNGRGTTPLQQEDGNAIKEQASLEAHPSSRNEQEPTDMSPILQSSSPPRKSADLSIAEKAPPRKLTALSKVVVEFTAQQLSAFLAFLRREKHAVPCGQGTMVGTTTGTTTTDDSTTTRNDDSTDPFLPLYCNNKYIEFEKLSEFDLDFGSFSYKVNEFGAKTKRDSYEAIRQAESRATKKIVAAIMDAGDDDEQRALALHRSLIHERTRIIAKSAGFKLERMEALSYHWDQLKKLVEVGSSKTGRANIDQSLVIDTILAAIASDLVPNADGTFSVDKKAPPLAATLDLLGMNAKSWRTRLKQAIQTRKELKVSKGVSRNAKWLTILKRQWKGHRKITPVVKQALLSWIKSHENVVTSPIYNETILVKEEASIKK
jgi:hypothetical protein